MGKRMMFLLLVLCMGFTLLPGTARAAEEPRELWVDGVDALETPQGDGWSYDAGTGVLTLGGAEEQQPLHVP